jgi:Lon protease-like protein
VAELPRDFAVFPLEGALLLPGGELPLNIFEPRYLAMVEDALGAGRMFGMIQPESSRGRGSLYRVGCLGRLNAFSETEDGRMIITLAGLARFAVLEELPMHRGYRRVRADFSEFEHDLADVPLGVDRQYLLDALRSFFAARSLQANWDAVRQLPDAELAVTLAMACPFAPSEKQALLEADSGARGATLLALLQMGAHAGDDPQQPRSIS